MLLMGISGLWYLSCYRRCHLGLEQWPCCRNERSVSKPVCIFYEQEIDHLKMAVAKMDARQFAYEYLLAKDISLAVNVKRCRQKRMFIVILIDKAPSEILLPGDKDWKMWMWHRCLSCP